MASYALQQVQMRILERAQRERQLFETGERLRERSSVVHDFSRIGRALGIGCAGIDEQKIVKGRGGPFHARRCQRFARLERANQDHRVWQGPSDAVEFA